jgi:uncharacterized protein (TIGR03083 family)
MGNELDYLDHVARDSARFTQVLAEVSPGTPVPTCPGWDADDLLWHLGEVQWFWGLIVSRNWTPAEIGEHRQERPGNRAGLLDFFAGAHRDLLQTLMGTAPQAARWTWSAEQTVGFVIRRQAHEALIHRVDAELTAGERTPMDPPLSADGVDEALRIMLGAPPRTGNVAPDEGHTARIVATDTGDSWLLTLGKLTGADPDEDGRPCIQVASVDGGGPAAATVTGRAADLDCWLWGRPPAKPVKRTGFSDVQDGLDAVFAAGIG